MTSLQVLRTTALVVGVTICFGVRAEARPPHLKVFAATYPQVAARNKMTCSVCHAGRDMSMRNNYGEALAKHIEVRELDNARIKAALEQTEPEPSAIRHKTFGDLLKLGLLPASRTIDDDPPPFGLSSLQN